MGAKHRKSKKQSNTSAHYQRQLRRTTFFLERSFGGNLILEELRKAGAKVEPHNKHFRHDTQDEQWLEVVGEKKWPVLMRDQMIGRRRLELDALLDAGTKAFVLVQGGLRDSENAKIMITALPKILTMVEENHFPFIARIKKDSTVVLWKTKPKKQIGMQRKRRKR